MYSPHYTVVIFKLYTTLCLLVTAAKGFYLIKDYYMDRGQSKAFMGACGRVVNEDCAYINSHVNTFSLARYGANQDCWLVMDAGEAPGARYDIEFLHWELQPPIDGGCHSDYLELYDGLVQNASSLIGRYCGWQRPNATHLKTQRYLTIKFVTDAADGYRGFKMIAIKTKASPCSSDEFLCAVTGRCINARLKCDGTSQCPDAQDEQDCNAWMQLVGCFMTMGLAGMIGFGIGVAGGCLLLLVLVSCCCCHRKNKTKSTEQSKPKAPRLHLVDICRSVAAITAPPQPKPTSQPAPSTPESSEKGDKTQLVVEQKTVLE